MLNKVPHAKEVKLMHSLGSAMIPVSLQNCSDPQPALQRARPTPRRPSARGATPGARATIPLPRGVLRSSAKPHQGHGTYVSFSAPLVLFLRCFCSLLAGGVCPMAGGFRFASIFRCLSISSRWEFILSCCLGGRE